MLMMKSEQAVSGPVDRHALEALEEIWCELLTIASAVESMLHNAVQVLSEGGLELTNAVKTQERSVNGWDVRIEETCIRALALYGPVASDLRRLVSVLRLRAELERVGDLATKIAKRSKRFFEDSSHPPTPTSLVVLAVVVNDAFSSVISALRRDDAVGARSLASGEEEIDRQCQVVLSELKTYLRLRPEQVTNVLRLMNSARNLERIGDHAVNIAEAIIFITEGLDHALHSSGR
jgi:phosphate transport system protein